MAETKTRPVRVSEMTYQTVRSLAEATSVSMTELIDRAVEAYRRRAMVEMANRRWSELMADDKVRDEIQAERRAFDASLLDGLDDEQW